uniref:Uncharacterized protein n=1 Tax=Arundo donax TaxID=35708 RepID=A0A0A8Z9F8_ARUDO
MNSGHCFVPAKLQVWLIAGELSFRICTVNTKEKVRQRKLLRRRPSGLIF